MLPIFLIEETTVRESGRSAVFDVPEHLNNNLRLTFGITHAVERESIGVDIFGSVDCVSWSAKPLVAFTPKSYCGTYELTLAQSGAKYLRADWWVKRWSGGGLQPFFRFYLLVGHADSRVSHAGAA
jgi:hypothetical protein